MGKYIDLTGQRFGRFAVLSRNAEKSDIKKHSYFNCICDCGKHTIVASGDLKSGSSKSCGCLTKEVIISRNTKHGDKHSKLYNVWGAIKARCCNITNKAYPNYGGRGIDICDEWLEFQAFKDWAMNNGYDKGLSIDRINNDGNYEPNNCRWTTRKVQTNNTRRNNRFEYNGESKTISELAEISGLKYRVLHDRLVRYKMDIQRAMNSPVR